MENPTPVTKTKEKKTKNQNRLHVQIKQCFKRKKSYIYIKLYAY
jgi:hypothetical protein